MNIPVDIDHTFFCNEPSAMVAVVRFDPTKNTLKGRLEDIHFSRAYVDQQPHLRGIFENLAKLQTSVQSNELLVGPQLENCTAAAQLISLWPRLPTLADYVDLDSLEHVQETELDFFEATKRQGW